MIEQKIANLYKKHCPRIVGVSRTIYELREATFIGEIKALIAEEQQPMVEALKAVKSELLGDNRMYILLDFIDDVLKGEGK